MEETTRDIRWEHGVGGGISLHSGGLPRVVPCLLFQPDRKSCTPSTATHLDFKVTAWLKTEVPGPVR